MAFQKQNTKFELVSPYRPTGDQPKAIESMMNAFNGGTRDQVLLGVTGSGKTFAMANVIAQLGKPTLIMCHNKTLAAQLFSEFREFFPNNAVEYFVSYYDYYQPEAYIPSTDTFIEKDSQINDEIDKLRHSATRSLLERNDVIIVSSVSCIYGLGSPEAYQGLILYFEVGRKVKRQEALLKLVDIQYKRNDVDFHRGTFRVRGDVVEIFPAYEEEQAIRVEFFDDEIESISLFDPLRGQTVEKLTRITIYPASHYVTELEQRNKALSSIREELRHRLVDLKNNQQLLEAQRLEQRTLYDLEMIEEIGFCQGIENYSRHLTGRDPGCAPPTLLEYFPKDWLCIIDESHVSIPQIGGMYRGDRARKSTLVDHGFRLPSALDNRPLNFQEWEQLLNQTLFVSATPGDYELKRVDHKVVEQLIRPTGLLDPIVEVRGARDQVDNLLIEIKKRVELQQRVLVTTLTKKFAEKLTQYYSEQGIKVKYLHSDIETLERIEILRDLRVGKFDVLVGINLLREGLDLPEVSLVAILDADKEGFLRSERSLIQTIGRAARNEEGYVILYADRITQSMSKAIAETERRRKTQELYNIKNNIQPKTIKKAIRELITPDGEYGEGGENKPTFKQMLGTGRRQKNNTPSNPSFVEAEPIELLDYTTEEERWIRVRELLVELGEVWSQKSIKNAQQLRQIISSLEKEMKEVAQKFEFEKAAFLRDRIRLLKRLSLGLT